MNPMLLHKKINNKLLSNYGQEKSKTNMQNMDLLAKRRCIMCTTIVYQLIS